VDHETQQGRRFRWIGIAVITVVALIVSAAGSFLAARVRRDDVVQPIAFNHRKHVTEQEIECSTCHEHYETETFAGLPTIDTCAMCHTEALGKSSEEKKLVAMIAGGEPLVWRSLFRQPAHVFYSHRRHVGAAKIECEQCHGDFATTTTPPLRVARLTMSECITCHEVHGVASACTTCHR
jgi:menaquinone reductase, multiheme cytochrome c subunit